MRTRFVGSALRRGAGALAVACLAAALAHAEEGAESAKGSPAKSDTARQTPRSAELGGVSIGMAVAEAGWTLEANGFRASESSMRRYVDDSGDVKRRIRYRELPGPDDALTIYELDETVWYPPGSFDASALEAEIRKRFGEPQQLNEQNVGRRELVYGETAGAPTVIEVIGACQKELQEQSPGLSAADAESKAAAVAQYNPQNDRIGEACPKALPLYRRMAEALEAPRMTIVLRSARVDTMVRWPWVEAELVRRLGPEQAARVIAFGPELAGVAPQPASEPAAEP